MATLTLEQRNMLKDGSRQPVRLVDPDTNQEYVLLPAVVYDQIQAAMADLDPQDFYPALQRALVDEGWNESHMDEYNRYG